MHSFLHILYPYFAPLSLKSPFPCNTQLTYLCILFSPDLDQYPCHLILFVPATQNLTSSHSQFADQLHQSKLWSGCVLQNQMYRFHQDFKHVLYRSHFVHHFQVRFLARFSIQSLCFQGETGFVHEKRGVFLDGKNAGMRNPQLVG